MRGAYDYGPVGLVVAKEEAEGDIQRATQSRTSAPSFTPDSASNRRASCWKSSQLLRPLSKRVSPPEYSHTPEGQASGRDAVRAMQGGTILHDRACLLRPRRAAAFQMER